MAKLQARTVGGPEDFIVTREFKALASDEQKLAVVRACFVIGAANGTISAEETAIVNEIAAELDIDDATLNAIRAEFHEQLSSVQADPPDHAAAPEPRPVRPRRRSTRPSPSRRRTSASSSAS